MILTALTYGFFGTFGVAIAKMLCEYLAKKFGSEAADGPATDLLKARNAIGMDQVRALVTIGETLRTIEIHLEDMIVSGETIPSTPAVVEPVLCGPARQMLEIVLNSSASETERSMAANTLAEIISGSRPC